MNTDDPGRPDSRREKTGLRKSLRNGFESVRQALQPGPIRIPAPYAYEGLPSSEAAATNEPSVGGRDSSTMDEQLVIAIKTLAAVATALWRAKAKLDAESQAELPAELRNLPRHIQAAWDALDAGKVQVDDFAGQRYVPGMAVNILTFQPLEGIGSEIIHETIKPSVYFNNTLIQRADVIVGRPVVDSDKPQPDDVTHEEEVSGEILAPDQKGTKANGPDND